MSNAAYEELAQALDRLPNGFPRTPSNVEIALLRKIFTEEEARLAGYLTGTMAPIEDVAQRAGIAADEARAALKDMARRGLLWFDRSSKEMKYRLAPFVVGFYEAQIHSMDKELAQLVDDYLADGGAAGIMKYDPALHRVIPVRGAAKGDWVLPYDDVRKILMKAKSFANHDCICRVQQTHLGRKCDFPIRNCLAFNLRSGTPGFDPISQDEALALLDEAEEVGLVHCVSNVTDDIGYICNCCGCCCAVLRGVTEWGIDKSVAYANYYAVVDSEKCTDCQTCHDRCHVNAIETKDDVSVIIREKCIGCGLCVTSCPEEAIGLNLKPENEIIHPPKDFPTWEKIRLENRGLA